LLRWLRRLAVAVAAALALLAIAELAAAPFLPKRSVRFLRAGRANGQPAWIDNVFFPYRFAPARAARPPPPTVVPQTPAPGTLRVCLLGGASAMGFPDASFGIGRQLEILLRHRYPDHPVEVVHMAFAGGNSHVLREVARDLKRLRPQAVVVMTGNEEVAGPYGPASSLGRFHHSSRIARGLVLFSRTRLSRLCAAALDRLDPARADEQAWRSREPITLRGRMSPRDPRLRSAYRSFRKNLTAILRQAAAAAPAVVACTVPVNLRDCAPFSTSFLDDETAAQQVREKLRAAIAAETATNRSEAARGYADVIRLDPTHAEALFRAAHLALAANRTAEAAALFSRARDADALRLRADARLNEIVRGCADEAGVSLLDAEALFAIRSPQGIPGHALFLDHVHFTFAGTHLLAASLLHRLEFLRAFAAEPTGPVADADTVAAELLYAPWGAAAQLEAAIEQQYHAPFRRQLSNADTLAQLNRDKAKHDARAAAISRDNACAIFARHRAARAGDPWLALRAADCLLQADAGELAEDAAAAALARWPHRFEIRAQLALARALRGQPAEAGLELLRGRDEDAGYYDVVQAVAVGEKLLEKKQPAAARPWLEYAWRRDAWNSEAALALAQALHRTEGGAAAVAVLQTAIERNPDNPLLWEDLAVQYCLLGNWTFATDCFRRSEEIAPYRYERLLKWAKAMVRLRQYSRALTPIQGYLAAMPDDPEGLEILASIRKHLPAQAEPPDDAAPKEKSPRKFPWE
jgi:lysophospholipase L1-like esterase